MQKTKIAKTRITVPRAYVLAIKKLIKEILEKVKEQAEGRALLWFKKI